MSGAVEARCNRFAYALLNYSAIADDIERLNGVDTDTRQIANYVESIYPPLLDGQSILDRAVDPVLADAIVADCPPLNDLADRVDARDRRAIWISDGDPPSEERFPRSNSAKKLWAGKPDGWGMFTSDAGQSDLGMWHIYGLTRSEFYSPPFRGWELTPASAVRVLDITNAEQWCKAVSQFSRRVEGKPDSFEFDWNQASQTYDAVNLSLRAVAAIDCVELNFHGMTVAASFWSVQTTVWLHWVFTSCEERRVQV